MSFWKRYEELCLEKGFKPSSETAVQLTGVSSAAITAWKKGAMPRIDILEKIANYFNVDMRYLIGMTNNKHGEDIIERITENLMNCGVEIDTFDDDNGAGTEYVLTYKGKSFNYQENAYLSKVYSEKHCIGQGTGRSKKAAQQNAAHNALLLMKQQEQGTADREGVCRPEEETK